MKKLILILFVATFLVGCSLFSPVFLGRKWEPKIENWRATTQMPVAGNDFGCFIDNDKIYIINMSSGDYFSTINSDGTLGEWQYIGASLDAEMENSAVSYNGYVYVLIRTTVHFAQILDTGFFGAWNSVDLPAGKLHGEIVINNGFLYVLSGNLHDNGYETFDSKIIYASIGSAGVPGAWKEATTYSILNRTEYAAVILNNFMYVIAGEEVPDGDTSKLKGLNLIEFAEINADGSLSEWQETKGIFNTTFAHKAVIHNDVLINIDGWSNWQEYGQQESDGHLEQWGINPPSGDFEERGRFGCVVYRDRIYILGGYLGGSENVSLDSVFIGDIIP